MKNKNFAIFILTHKRADKVTTYNTLKKTNYKGPIYLIVDDKDPQLAKYQKNFGIDNVKVFNKKTIGKKFDIMDNFKDDGSPIFARNANFEIAKKMGIDYFWMLDDDYSSFTYRYTKKLEFVNVRVNRMEELLDVLIDFYRKTNFKSIAVAQAGDFIGGDNGFIFSKLRIRKVMNTFICSTKRPFKFKGKLNDDVNTYVDGARRGDLFLTIPYVMVTQKQTQLTKGGLTEIYRKFGTYVKSFYTIMVNPASVKIAPMGLAHPRLHHRICSNEVYQRILSEEYKKIT